MARSQINYKHLYYFWVVAREGSIAKAAKILHLTPQTISGQLSQFEDSIRTPLFQKQGRGISLTESGQLVLRYATDIFHLGEELQQVLQDKKSHRRQRLVVGVLDSIPKAIAYKILEPAIKHSSDLTLNCIEGNLDQLVSQLAVNSVDVVLSDTPISASYNIKTYSHLLGESAISFFASPQRANQLRRAFPKCLDGAPMLMPTDHSLSGRVVKQWLRDNNLHPKIKGYFDDSALLKAFGKAGEGMFFMPTVIEKAIIQEYNVRCIGTVEELSERYYAITTQRRIRHPAVNAICEAARDNLFSLHD
jgi:LysR family transcriptional regulator, transcriptional activator of nhaA